jgi:hypothetical protein
MWHCPHCGAPQAETARCWVCRRSSTTCSTCRHFRRSLAADVGWCSLDSKRAPLTGLELRGCWQARSSNAEVPAPGTGPRARHRPHDLPIGEKHEPGEPHALDFIPVELLGQIVSRQQPGTTGGAPSEPSALPVIGADTEEGWAERTSLFGDLEA